MIYRGDDKKGYELKFRANETILHLRVWGLWDAALGEAYKKDMMELFKKLKAAGKSWFVIGDITNFPPQNDDVQAVHAYLMTETVKHGMVKAGNVVSSALSKMQIARLSKESGLEHAFHTTVESAEAWLLHGTVPT